MNKLICSLIVAVGFGSLPVASASESAAAPSLAHASAQRIQARKHHRHHTPVHHRHHRHHHHSKG